MEKKHNLLLVENRRQQARGAHHRVLKLVYQRPNSASVKRVLRMIQLMKETEHIRLRLHKSLVDLVSDPANSSQIRPFATKPGTSSSARVLESKSEKGTPFDYALWLNKKIILGRWRNPELKALNVEYKDRMRKIEKGLKRYRWNPTVRDEGFDRLYHMFLWPGRRDSEKFWENWSMRWLIEQINGSGQSPAPILRFRNCRQCSKWFYARTNPQVHCAVNCRLKSYRDSPEFRAKAAKYMRETYRPTLKEIYEGAKRKVVRRKPRNKTGHREVHASRQP